MAQVRFKFFVLNDSDFKQHQKKCDVENCLEHGLYKAPKSREQLADYFWFCRMHVRDYNAQWDYYKGMNKEEIESHLRADTVWQKPTWPFGHHGKSKTQTEKFSQLPREISEALFILELSFPFSLDQLRTNYKNLVKQYHPDRLGHEKETKTTEATEKLKEITTAYATIRHYLAKQKK